MPIPFQVPMENAVELTNGANTGICMAISSFWVQRCSQLGFPPPGGDMFFTDWRHYETMGVTFETLLGDYDALTGGDAMIHSQGRLQLQGLAWHDQFAEQLGLPVFEINWGTLDTLDFLLALMEAGPARRYLLTGYATQNLHGGGLQLNGGHTVAFAYGPPGHASYKSFMDPNFGQWTVARGTAWSLAIIAHLTYYYPGFNQWVLVEIG
jgi:hypothetical protein